MKVSKIEPLKKELLTSSVCRQQIVEMLMETVIDTMQVFDFGAAKHPDSGDVPNFLTPNGNKCSLHERGSGVLRHAARTFMNPDKLDDESGLSEYLHLLASCAILYIRHKRNIVHPDDNLGVILNSMETPEDVLNDLASAIVNGKLGEVL